MIKISLAFYWEDFDQPLTLLSPPLTLQVMTKIFFFLWFQAELLSFETLIDVQVNLAID